MVNVSEMVGNVSLHKIQWLLSNTSNLARAIYIKKEKKQSSVYKCQAQSMHWVILGNMKRRAFNFAD